MQLIRSAAHFAVCECGEHGRVITLTGEKSRDVVTKRRAYETLAKFIAHDLVDPDEINEARRQIADSSLPYENEDLEEHIDMLYQLTGGKHIKVDEKAAHRTLDTLLSRWRKQDE